MSTRLPPSLAYFLIYNPTISPEPNTERESDEDAREESHILFYTSQDQVTSKDTMLRQAGLAKAIINFSGLFTSAHNVDNIHTQSKRMVSISPEPDFWMHICVNLAKTPKSSKKSKEANKPVLTTNYYHQESVPDALLRDYLLQGYEEFKLFHGTFSSNLSAGQLQRQLERFFTPWSWQLDFDSSDNMYHQSGPHVHSSDLLLQPIVSEFAKTLPSDSLPILLTSSHFVTFSEEYEYPSSLLRFLWSVSRTADAETTVNARQGSQKPENGSSGDGNHDDKPATSSSFFGPGIGSVMNIKKWSWPGSLTFGGTVAVENSQGVPSDVVAAPGTSTTTDQAKGETLPNSGAAPDHKVTSPVQLDQSALEDAMATTNDHSMPTMEDAYIPLVSEGSDSPNLPHVFSGPAAKFISKSIFVPGPNILDPQPRQLLYISALHSIFALVVDVSWSQEENPEFLNRLLFNTMRFLRKARDTLEQNTSTSTVKPRRSDYILRFQPNLTYADGVIAKEGVMYLNENNKLMQDDDDVQEIFSRPQTPKAWFVSRRYPNLSSSNRTCTEANFAVNIKEASLIGANNEIESVIRHFSKR